MLSSDQLFNQAQKVMPGGVNSPVRAFGAVGGTPVFIDQAHGAYLTDLQGKRYIDHVCSWGSAVLGHAHPNVVKSVQKAAQKGLSFGAPTLQETELAQLITQLMPNIEKVRLVNSGTEATMTAIRLARGFTGRDKLIKFEGCYHGHSDSLLVKAGSGALTFGNPSSPGVPMSLVEHTCIATFNDLESVTALFEAHKGNIAAIIVEPVACNMNCVLPTPGFLEGLRELCDKHQALLIFDEVITGFRLGLSGAQQLFNIKPDLTTLGKIIGGGMPVGAFGGRSDIMSALSPEGPVYQAGTLSGNPLATAAGIANLEQLMQPGFYSELKEKTQRLTTGLKEAANKHHIPLHINQIESIFGLFFTDQESVTSFEDVKHCNQEHFKQFFHGMLEHGIYLAPSSFESGFVSAAHGLQEIDMTIAAAEKVFASIT